jgi:hypothetical protein
MAFDICRGLDEDVWRAMDAGERFDFLRELIDTALTDWGYDSVDVVAGTPPKGAEMQYDRNRDEVTIDTTKVGAADYTEWEAASLAIHETLHAVDDQDYGGSYDYGGDQSQSPVHNQLDLTAKEWITQQLEACRANAQSSVYPGRNTLPPIDWGAGS